MEKKTNYGKIIFITLLVVAAFAAIAYIVYRLFVKNLEKCYADEDGDQYLFEEDDNYDCECAQCDALADAE